MRVSYSTLVKAKRAGRATSVRVQPTGTAVDQYQIPLGNRHSLREAGVIELPSWSERSTQNETWTKVPRLSATCPRRVVAYDGGRSDIDKTMEFGDDFDGSAIDTAKWTATGSVSVFEGRLSATVTSSKAVSVLQFGLGIAMRLKFVPPSTSYVNIGFDDNTTSSNYAILYEDDDAPYFRGQHRAFGGSAVVADLPEIVVAAYTGEIARAVGGGIVYTVDANTAAASGGPSAALPIRIYSPGGGTTYLYWILVRKYVANEPLTGTVAPTATNRALSRPMSHADLMRACCA